MVCLAFFTNRIIFYSTCVVCWSRTLTVQSDSSRVRVRRWPLDGDSFLCKGRVLCGCSCFMKSEFFFLLLTHLTNRHYTAPTGDTPEEWQVLSFPMCCPLWSVCFLCWSDCSYTCHLECQRQVQLDCNQRDRQTERTPPPSSSRSSAAPRPKVRISNNVTLVEITRVCAEVYLSQDWVMSGFILQPTLLHNPPPLSQRAVPPPQLCTYIFTYALICCFVVTECSLDRICYVTSSSSSSWCASFSCLLSLPLTASLSSPCEVSLSYPRCRKHVAVYPHIVNSSASVKRMRTN